ncbi:hypothetical protein ACFS07_36515 [Undibacterium arcticum]
MSKLDAYLHAATRDNTRRSYQAAARHFEVEWGGFLPATADAIARYLVDHAESLAINTLRQRLAALAQWHIDQGFFGSDQGAGGAQGLPRHSGAASGAGKSARGRCSLISLNRRRNGSTGQSPSRRPPATVQRSCATRATRPCCYSASGEAFAVTN